MLLQNKFTFFRSFFFTSLFVLSIFIFSPSAEAVGATPPTISYDPYTYENIVPPNGGRSAVNGGKLVQLTGANQLPKLTATYLNDGSNDPWKGGTVRFHWESHVKLTNVLDLVNITAQGFAFVAIINLPEHVSSSDVLKAIDWNNAYLYIAGAPIKERKFNISRKPYLTFWDGFVGYKYSVGRYHRYYYARRVQC